MLVSLKWLADYVPLTLPPKELAERLTLAGAKVEKVISRGDTWDLMKVGHVIDIKPHPNADRLRLVTVDIDAEFPQTVVCGAPNVAKGQKIAFGLVGAHVRDGHGSGEWTTLKPAKIRGVESAGMVLSELELGISEDHTGILVLPEDAPTGKDLKEYLGDVIYDIEVTPNRPDLLSVLGLAWEVAGQTHAKVVEPERVYPESAATSAAQRTSVTIEDKDLCSRYLAGIIERVKVGPSPEWLQERLRAAGQRPINNVVDITNFVMLEMGQPLHAFDFRKLGGGRIVVRRAREGERLRTIDGVARDLTTEMLVIADATKPVAVGGIMGGFETEVTEGTTTVLLESANFNLVNIRATSGALGLRTEASIRFEKGLHPELAAAAIKRAMKLFVDITGGRASKGLVDTYAVKRPDTRVVVTRNRIQQVLGTDLTTTQVRTTLTDIGFGCRWVPPDRYVVRVPYWRTDVTQPDDVVEELARVMGYDRIEALPLSGSMPPPIVEPVRELRDQLKDAAVAAGLQEVITYPLTSNEMLNLVQPPEALEVAPPLRMENPMSSELSVMRTTLRASVLQTVAANLRNERGTVAVFEAAHAFVSRTDDLPAEREMLVGAVAGFHTGRWGEPLPDRVDFYDAKGLIEDMFERTGIQVDYRNGEEYGLLKGHTAELQVEGARVGVLGQVHPTTAAQFEIDAPVYLFELDVEALLPAVRQQVRHKPLSRFPEVTQDIALIVDAGVPAAQVQALIEGNALVTAAQIFDVYEGAPLPEGKRSLAFSVHFQSAEKTLTDAEVADARRRIVRRLEHELGAELRGQA